MKIIPVRVEQSLWTRLMYLKAEGKIKSFQEFFVSLAEKEVNRLEEERGK